MRQIRNRDYSGLHVLTVPEWWRRQNLPCKTGASDLSIEIPVDAKVVHVDSGLGKGIV